MRNYALQGPGALVVGAVWNNAPFQDYRLPRPTKSPDTPNLNVMYFWSISCRQRRQPVVV
jgi:hypothetical protein